MGNWKFDQFLGYILIHAAASDQEVARKELKVIEKKVGKDILDEMMEIYMDDSDMKRIDTILSYKSKYYPTDSDVESLLDQIKTVDEADAEIDSAEEMTIIMLRKLLKQ